ncbi:MAG: hypothetical protein P8P74_16050 [Crocinitomicaceae bacterium]|nr:hypothetical protein [Crocinitomicaceae bacterium]
MNVGCVIYKKNARTGEMSAVWRFDNDTDVVVGGTGDATGSAGAEYEGEYEITYYINGDPETPDGPYNLKIVNEGNYYTLSWYKEGKLQYSGIGMSNGRFLTAGWKSTTVED